MFATSALAADAAALVSFPEDVGTWVVATEVGAPSHAHIVERIGWEDAPIIVNRLDEQEEAELEVYSVGEFKFDGIYIPRRQYGGRPCYKKEALAGTGIKPTFLFFEVELELWVMAEGADLRSSNILAVALPTNHQEKLAEHPTQLSHQWAVATGDHCPLDPETIFNLGDGWEFADVKVSRTY